MHKLLKKRRAGILLHITSLPGAGEHGDLGPEAYNFVNFLKSTGVTVWQTLPLGMTHNDGSPYQCLSAHAGNPEFIHIDMLVQQGWLRMSELDNTASPSKTLLLSSAYAGFLERASEQDKASFTEFCDDKAFWLDDFSLFVALRNEFNQQCWNQWPTPFKERYPEALNGISPQIKLKIEEAKFTQFVFFRQWMALKTYANEQGVLLFGDIPIFVSYDSADVWANRHVFKLDADGNASVVAGVPPDYFSDTGQRWGNPHYNWECLENNRFIWWIHRMVTQFEQLDILRIDHFRGLEAAWEIPAQDETAKNGVWVKAPGKALLNTIYSELGNFPLVAEDLGVITPEVEALRAEFQLPGMKILQFAFGSGPTCPYLPSNFDKNCVVYTGTHDNDTTLGWLGKISDQERSFIYEYLDNPDIPLHHALIHAALRSVANLAVIPMQDVLELGTEHRMNVPGTSTGNWQWRFQWHQLSPEQATRFGHWISLYNRN